MESYEHKLGTEFKEYPLHNVPQGSGVSHKAWLLFQCL